MNDSNPSDTTRDQWRAWLACDPRHAQAWQRIKHLQHRLGQAPAGLAMTTLEQARQQRRATFELFSLLLGAGVVGWRGYQASPWSANYATGIGHRREFALSDGTRLMLDTDSRVDVRFDDQQRLVILRAGEILIETAKDARPLSVQTAEGNILALGTRFAVHQDAGLTRVTVEAHAVEVQPRLAPAQSIRAQAGQTVTFAANQVGALLPARSQALAWTRGMLVVVDWRLADVVAELSRYRDGYLGCSPEVAELRLSGSFLLDDSDGALANLQDALPVRLRQLTRYWVRVEGKNV